MLVRAEVHACLFVAMGARARLEGVRGGEGHPVGAHEGGVPILRRHVRGRVPPQVRLGHRRARLEQHVRGRQRAAHGAPMQRRLARVVAGIDGGAAREQRGEGAHPVVERGPLQGEEALLVGLGGPGGVGVQVLLQLSIVAVGRGLCACARGEVRD